MADGYTVDDLDWVRIHSKQTRKEYYFDLCDLCYKSLKTFMEQYKECKDGGI